MHNRMWKRWKKRVLGNEYGKEWTLQGKRKVKEKGRGEASKKRGQNER